MEMGRFSLNDPNLLQVIIKFAAYLMNVRDMGYNGTHDDDALRPRSVGAGLTPRGSEHEGSWGCCRERRPTNREARYFGRDKVSGRKGGSQGKEVFGVLGTLGAGSEGGSRSQDPSRGTGRSKTGKLSASRVTVCIACCNVSAIKSSLSSYVNSVVVVDH